MKATRTTTNTLRARRRERMARAAFREDTTIHQAAEGVVVKKG
jgi:hypothetical protein